MEKKEAYKFIWEALQKAAKSGVYDLNESNAIINAYSALNPEKEKEENKQK